MLHHKIWCVNIFISQDMVENTGTSRIYSDRDEQLFFPRPADRKASQ